MADRAAPAAMFGAVAVALGLCCGVPLLLSAGVLTAIGGVGVGSWTLVGIGAIVATVAGVRTRRRTAALLVGDAESDSEIERSQERYTTHAD